MATLQKMVSDIRELEVEEIDLVGGGFTVSAEATETMTNSAYSYVANGHSYTITITDDASEDVEAGTDS